MYETVYLHKQMNHPVTSLVRISTQGRKQKPASLLSLFIGEITSLELKTEFQYKQTTLHVSVFDHAYMENTWCYKQHSLINLKSSHEINI